MSDDIMKSFSRNALMTKAIGTWAPEALINVVIGNLLNAAFSTTPLVSLAVGAILGGLIGVVTTKHYFPGDPEKTSRKALQKAFAEGALIGGVSGAIGWALPPVLMVAGTPHSPRF